VKPKVLQVGAFCRVVLAEDARGTRPAEKGFFGDRHVDANQIKKMHGRLRRVAQNGYPNNPEAYKLLDGDIHYIKCHGWRAYCMERSTTQGRELVVCLVVQKRHSGSLGDELKSTTRRIFDEHCENS
jgi:hypothetical protein